MAEEDFKDNTGLADAKVDAGIAPEVSEPVSEPATPAVEGSGYALVHAARVFLDGKERATSYYRSH